MTCEITESIGAYLFGALDYSEWREIDRHLEQCDVCRPELVRLAGLPGLIGRLPVDDVIANEPERSSSASRTRPRRSASVRRTWLAAASLVIALVGTFAGIAATRAPTGRGAATAKTTGTATTKWSTAFALSGSNPATGVHGGASLTAERWGTEIWVRVQGIKPGTPCELVVSGRKSRAIVAGTWTSDSTKAFWVPGSAPMNPSGITSVKIATAAGVAVTLMRHSGSPI